MTLLIIISAIVILIFLVLITKVSVILGYDDDLSVKLRILFVNIPIYPKKKKIKISEYKYNKYRRKLEKQRKKKDEKRNGSAAGKKKKRSLKRTVGIFSYIVKKIVLRFARRVSVKVEKINVVVASEDPAKTAILYGVIHQSVEYIICFLEEKAKLKGANEKTVTVDADFIGTSPSFRAKVTFNVTAASLLDIMIKIAYNYLKDKLKNNAKVNSEEK